MALQEGFLAFPLLSEPAALRSSQVRGLSSATLCASASVLRQNADDLLCRVES